MFSENHPNQYFGQVGQGWSGLVRLVRVGQGWSGLVMLVGLVGLGLGLTNVRGRFTCGWTACLPACLPDDGIPPVNERHVLYSANYKKKYVSKITLFNVSYMLYSQ
jgi:hypothetical protein